MSVEISVICLTYNSDIKKTLTTLNSVISQKNCDFEVIIADDGSKQNNFDEIKNFFEAKKFTDYKLIANEINVGIICNYSSAIESAHGKYIKYISPGDYLYDEFTLKKCIDFMVGYDAEFAFGKALYYSSNNNDLVIINKQDPVFIELYDADKEEYDFDKVLKYLVLWQDCILGAAVIADRLVFEKYLREIVGKVKYIEDNTIMPLVTLDKKRIYCLNEYILWYESDSGISTNVNRGFKEKIDLDFLNCYKYMKEKAPENNYIKLAYLKQKYLVQKNRLLLFFVKRILDIFYGRFEYKQNTLKAKGQYILSSFDKKNWYKWHSEFTR